MAFFRFAFAIIALSLVATCSASSIKLGQEPTMDEAPVEESLEEAPMDAAPVESGSAGEAPMGEESMGDAPLAAEETTAEEAPVEAALPPPEESCESLCEHDTGMDAETCRTECAVHTDVMTHHPEQALQDFVEDEATNEHGGQAMEEHAEEELGMEIEDCTPTVDEAVPPAFSDIDTEPRGGLFGVITGDGDGFITMEEAQAWARSVCIPDEDMHQLFSETDTNQDGLVSAEEFAAAGEDTQLEEEIDEEFDKALPEGDDEVNTADMPDFETFDENGDGILEEDEIEETFELEADRRGASQDELDLIKEEVDNAVEKIDEDGDNALSREEFEKGTENDLGAEMKEHAMADEDAEDPDDLHREGSKAARKADREAEKAAKKAEKEAEKAAKKAEKEVEKAAKKAERKAAKKASKFLEVRRPAPFVARSVLHTGARHRRAIAAHRSAAAARRMRLMARIMAPGSAAARWQAAAVAIALRKAEHKH